MDRGLEDGAVGIGPALIPLPHPRYRKAFDVEPSLHSGINAAVLLIAAGQRFEDSEELRLIGASQPCAPRPTSRPQRDRGRVRRERNNGWAGAGLWLEGRGDQPFESILTALQPNLEPVTDTSIPSRRAFPNGNPRASHCRASGYFGGKSYKLFHPKGNPDPRMAEPSEALYTVGA